MPNKNIIDHLLPKACQWAADQERRILREGVPLSEAQIVDAKHVGVMCPDMVRVLHVREIPVPDDPILVTAATAAGLFFRHSAGMSLRYGIYLRRDIDDERGTLIHELTHTAQYERLGGILSFMQQYVAECLTVGYSDCSLEQEAVETTNRVLRQST